MTAAPSDHVPTIHASAVLAGAHALLIRGPSGSGKSALTLSILQSPAFPFSRLIGDDRVHLAVAHGRLLVRPAHALAGLLEVRGLGIRRMPFEPVAVVGLVVDLGEAATLRLPEAEAGETSVENIRLARLAVAPGSDTLALVLEAWGRLKTF